MSRKMMILKLRRIVSLILVLLALFTVPAFAVTDDWSNPDSYTIQPVGDGSNSIGSNNEDGFKEIANGSIGNRISNSKKYYSFTVFEVEDGWLGVKVGVGNVLNGLANVFFSVAKMWMEFVAKLTYQTLNLDLYKQGQRSIGDFIDKIGGLAGNVYGGKTGLAPIIWIGAALSFMLVVLMFVRKQTSGALGKIIVVAFLLALISSYATIPAFFMDSASKLVTDAGSAILKLDNGNPKESIARQIWIMGVDIPWQQLEFGSVHCSASSGGVFGITDKNNKEMKWLSTFPDDRQSVFENGGVAMPKGAQENAQNSAFIQATRAGESLFVLIIDAIVGLVFLILSAVALGFQIGAIIMWVVGFFVLIVALFPTHNTSKLKDWLGILAMTYFGQLVVYVLIMLVTQIVEWFYDIGNDLFTTFGLMVGLGFGLKLMFGPIMQLFSGSGTGAASSKAIVQGLNSGARGVRMRLGGYKGDSTERLMPNPIRQNREAKRQVQKEEKMRQYQAKVEARRNREQAKKDRSVTAAVKEAGKEKVREATAPVREHVSARQNDKAEFASDIKNRGIKTAVKSQQAEREVREEQKLAHYASRQIRKQYIKARKTGDRPTQIQKAEEYKAARMREKAAEAKRTEIRKERNAPQTKRPEKRSPGVTKTARRTKKTDK